MHDKLIFMIDADTHLHEEVRRTFQARGMKVEGFATAENALLALHYRQPDFVILEHELPDMDGADVQQRLAAHGIPHIFLSAGADAPAIVRAMRMGAGDFMIKPTATGKLYDRVADLMQAGAHTPASGAQEDLRETLIVRMRGLTRRERSILQLALTGKSNKEISLVLGISHRTVETHRAHILEKICVSNLLQLAYVFSDLDQHLLNEGEAPHLLKTRLNRTAQELMSA